MIQPQHDFTPGRWALIARGSYTDPLDVHVTDVLLVMSTTESLVKVDSNGLTRQYRKSQIVATFADRADAVVLVNKIGGIRGEMKRRIAAANDAAQKSLSAILANTDA
jgi:hypothetical protein